MLPEFFFRMRRPLTGTKPAVAALGNFWRREACHISLGSPALVIAVRSEPVVEDCACWEGRLLSRPGGTSDKMCDLEVAPPSRGRSPNTETARR